MGSETWFQVEFYSDIEQRWVALFAREKTVEEAEKKRLDWLANSISRVTRVTQTKEVVSHGRDQWSVISGQKAKEQDIADQA